MIINKTIQTLFIFSFLLCFNISASANEFSTYDFFNAQTSPLCDTLDKEVVFKVVEEPPLFAGCEDQEGGEKSACATEKMLNYIYSNLRYPEEGRVKGIEGTSVIRFIVRKDGTLSDFEIVRLIGGGCDEEALRVVKSMPAWNPGIHKGEAVNVKFNIPVKFRLENGPSSKNESTDVLKEVEMMPRFPGCTEGDESMKKACAQKLMLEYIYNNVKYPEKAVKKGVEGTIVIRFNVLEDGTLENIECVRDIGAGCGMEGVKVVSSMPDWEPGIQDGKPVKVQFNLPIKFKLDKKSKKKVRKKG